MSSDEEMVQMAVMARDGMEPVAYLEALAENPEIALEKGSLDALAHRYGHDPSYVDYYQKSGLDIVPDVIDAQLSGKGTDFSAATPEQIAQVVRELESVPEPAAETGHETQTQLPQADGSHTLEPGTDGTAEPQAGSGQETGQPAQSLPDEQVLAELAAELGADAAAEIQRSKAEFFAYVTQHLWQEVRAALEEEARAQVAEQRWSSAEEAKAAAYEPAYNAMIAAIEGLWDAGAEEGGFAPLLGRPQS